MSAKYEIWLFPEGSSQGIVLPALPEEISIDYGCGLKFFSVDSLGEVPMRADRAAHRISFSSIFPSERLSGGSKYTLAKPRIYVDFFSKWAERSTPLRLSVVGANISMYCMIEHFKVYERGGDVGTRYYDISFVEHRPIKNRQVNLASGGNRVDNRSSAFTYTVKLGDFLIKIAREQLGNSSRYMEIYNLNRDILSDPNRIYPGQVLKLPK